MKKQFKVNINVDSESINQFTSFVLEQRFNSHHVFTLRYNLYMAGLPKTVNLDQSRDYIGKKLTIQFGNLGEEENVFAGIITKVDFLQSHGYLGEIELTGYSPTILIDRGPDIGSYLNQDLSSIIRKATNDVPENDISIKINDVRKEPIDYMIQYLESDFSFLNRLSSQYHEMFFYDGVQIQFGKPDIFKEVKIVYGRDLHTIQYGMNIAPLNYRKFSYNSVHDQVFTSQPKSSPSDTQDLSHAINASKMVYSKVYSQPLHVRIDSQKDIDSFVDNEQSGIISQLVKLSGSGDNPYVGIGRVLDITMSLKEETGFVTTDFGKFLVTGISHHMDGLGHYHHTFEAIPANSKHIPVESQLPLADIQVATVLDNDDPLKQGRIKVKFNWDCINNDPTEWLRVVTPNAGQGVRGANRGFLAIPEQGDQVLVNFEEGNVARPIVMGSVYNNSNADSSKQIENHLKSITTRSGHLIEFDDHNDTQGIRITDIRNNVIHIDTSTDSITITALENMTLNAKNMKINVEENLDVQVGKDMRTQVSQNNTFNTGKHFQLQANTIAEQAKVDISIRAKKIVETADEVQINSNAENMVLYSGKSVMSKSVEKNKLF
jgi:type VI secretion system secreted protein VgrG